MDRVKVAFEPTIRLLALDQILPSKMLSAAVIESAKYKRIAASLAEVGLVEPLVIGPMKVGDAYPLLDGHVRLSILKEQGVENARCLVSSDDEGFTYNKRVNRLATIQEHYMIVRAIERGVSEDKLAKALNADIAAIRRRRHLLNGINDDVAELLKDKPVGIHAFQKLRQMKPIRQLEVAELMVSANNYSASYARALLMTTKPADLVKPESKVKAGLNGEQIEKLERELAAVSHDYRELETSFGDDTLVLVIAAGFLERILGRPAIEAYLTDAHPEMLQTFRSVVAAASLDQTAQAA
ncbi:plasmid partitioning protein RepB C-terminal domain-containing protein [Brevundimonas sp. M20]|uniref:plasmid partitioning protein RepB C-terminal domain-containing protein n=1 Tax=Brevundimonas sp. M20 TaxID=2591463 RepID=UPI0011469746|nr:plasmid partitioning protein RepB C-terminal domain-containing protein [Brevundimonas sp. M20]QDH74227.1 chromosome partitioning protein ParB [Brevundimonas sp. M20]